VNHAKLWIALLFLLGGGSLVIVDRSVLPPRADDAVADPAAHHRFTVVASTRADPAEDSRFLVTARTDGQKMSFGLSLLDATTRPGSVVVLIPDSATIEQLPVAAQDKACLPAGQPFNVHFKEDLRREAHPALSPVRDFPAREYYFDDLSTCTIGPPLLAWSDDVAPVAAGLAARSIVIEANSWFGYHRPENSELDYRSPVLLNGGPR
jgi:hypothetical protein